MGHSEASASVAEQPESRWDLQFRNSSFSFRKCVFVGGSNFQVVNPLDVGPIRKPPALVRNRSCETRLILKGPMVRERIGAGIVVVLVVAHEKAELNTASRTQQMRPAGAMLKV